MDCVRVLESGTRVTTVMEFAGGCSFGSTAEASGSAAGYSCSNHLQTW